ncbi:MAG: divergent PAP2 family protein [archaeon]
MNDFLLIVENKIVISTFLSFLIASALKVIINGLASSRYDISLFFKSGHMPSSHSASVAAAAYAVYRETGVSELFIVALIFASIVLYDAMGVRRAAGKQAEVINKIVEDLHYFRKFKTKRLYEFIGHTPKQVIAGIIVALVITAIVYA